MIALAALLATGCISIDFDPPNVVTGPRILAIGATPPEAQIGQDVVFEALVVDEEGNDLTRDPDVELRFMVCLSVASIVSAAGLGASADLEDNCGEGGDDLIRLEQGGDLPPGSARFSGAAVFALIEELMMGGGMQPMGGDPMLLETLGAVIAQVGLPLRMRLEVWRDGEQIFTGFKRFAIATREDLTTNPPPPRFAIDGVWVSARGEGADPHVCVPEEGVIPTVEDRAEAAMTPDENDVEWFEEYPVVTLEGDVEINEENAYYSWFSIAGRFASDITLQPTREVTWATPDDSGVYPVWLVVRDGHLGSSWCRTEVYVD